MNLFQRSLPAGHPGLRSFPYTYGIIHAVVDASTIMVVFCTAFVHHLTPREMTALIFTYDFLAFAGQAFFGIIADKLRITRSVVMAGIALTLVSVLLLRIEPHAAAIVAGVGNALFHLGAGALSLNVKPGRAAAPGIFVGPGALGLGLGMFLGKSGIVLEWPFLVALSVCLGFAAVSTNPKIDYTRNTEKKPLRFFWPALMLLLLSISVRAFVGYTGGYQMPKEVEISFALAIAAFAGKSLGGVLSDRFGWILVSVGALLVSAPMIAVFGHLPVILITGMFLFQMTMPVTLVAIAEILPGKPAFAFGLSCLVLVAGAFAAFLSPKSIYSIALFLGLVVASAASVWGGLKLIKTRVKMKYSSSKEATSKNA